jgi:S-formylglutathione hydrolase
VSAAGLERAEHHASFGGWQDVWAHDSAVLGCRMRFGVYLPPQAASGPCPVLYWLSGLTCSEQNFITKAGVQRYAAEHGLIVVAPDTSPRGEAVADDPGYDLGQGAGFYVNATQAPWATHYRMYDYVTEELPALIEAEFPASDRRSVFGHSMGGHGALVVALRNPGRYASVSAFAPITAPSRVSWGQKALLAYLGDDPAAWAACDATRLLEGGCRFPGSIRIEQGGDDEFLGKSLTPQEFEQACRALGQPVELRMRDGYDHSYYFIASFIGQHMALHAQALHRSG